MRAFALTCEALAHLDSVEGKVQCAAAYLIARDAEEIAIAARCLAGAPLPPGSPATNVGAASVATVIAERCGIPSAAVRRRAVISGDLGTTAAALLEAAEAGPGTGISLVDVARTIGELGDHSAEARLRLLRRLYGAVDPLEAKYLTKLLVGSMRTGMQLGRVEEAIALAFRLPPEGVRRAHMLLGDIGLLAQRAHADDLGEVRLRAFRPLRSMLAHPAENLEAALADLNTPLIVEPKLDGVRAQVHVRGARHRVYSRSLEDVTHLFPELGAVTTVLDGEWILDGEIVAWKDAVLPFEQLQQRLGRRQVPLTMLLDVPVVYQAFDALRAGGDDLLDEPLLRRKELLDRLPLDGPVRRLRHEVLSEAATIATRFEESVEQGHEGLVLKQPGSAYHPGARGRDWIKLKRPLGALNVVVTAAQYGSGKRAGWLSDLTFAVRGTDGELLDVGKAYSGLTD
ncbi:MAG: RNA ligase family protein, partial [Acidobacteriota bacterium]